jgi:hypothetical protein
MTRAMSTKIDWLRQTDIVVGVPPHRRGEADVADIMTFFGGILGIAAISMNDLAAFAWLGGTQPKT